MINVNLEHNQDAYIIIHQDLKLWPGILVSGSGEGIFGHKIGSPGWKDSVGQRGGNRDH